MIVGFAAGIEFEKLRHVRSDVQQQLQSNWREQHGITVVSLGVLDALETGDTEKAKSLLARFTRRVSYEPYNHIERNYDCSY